MRVRQRRVAGVTDVTNTDDLYPGDERVGATLTRVHHDALGWVESRA
jgi:hypothetical protein